MKFLKGFVKLIIAAGTIVLLVFAIMSFSSAATSFAQASKANNSAVKDALSQAGTATLQSGFITLISVLTNIGILIYLFQIDSNENEIALLKVKTKKNSKVVDDYKEKEYKQEAIELSKAYEAELDGAEEKMLTDEYISKCIKYSSSKLPSNFLEHVLYYLAAAQRGVSADELMASNPDLIKKNKLYNTEKNGLIVNSGDKYYLTDYGFKFLERNK